MLRKKYNAMINHSGGNDDGDNDGNEDENDDDNATSGQDMMVQSSIQ